MERGAGGRRNGAAVLARSAASLLIAPALTWVSRQFIPVNSTTAALTFVLAVLAVAAWWELREAVCASISGWLCLNYFFLEPVGTFSVAHPQDWVSFFAFLVTSVVGSHLATSARKRATERAHAEQAAERMAAARRNEETKAMLLDALAHEFKTPLTSIKAAASSLLETAASDQVELVTIIEEEADRMNTLVSETIRMARIDAGSLRLEKRPHLIGDLIADALGPLRTVLEDRDVRIELPDQPLRVLADADLISLTVRQLVGNALKYANPDSPIVVWARNTAGFVRVGVKDCGPGIPESERHRVFERFYRAANHGAVAGSGMGLAIARDIVRAHGGEVRVESVVGEGSEFSFTLPSAGEPA